jgi:hypothetical protein
LTGNPKCRLATSHVGYSVQPEVSQSVSLIWGSPRPFISTCWSLWSAGHPCNAVSLRRMPSSGMLRRVALVRTDVSEELSASIIRVTRIGELGTLAVTSNRLLVTANVVPSYTMIEAICSSETSILTRATWRNIPEDGILHSHRRENLKSYAVSLQFLSLTDGWQVTLDGGLTRRTSSSSSSLGATVPGEPWPP